MGALKSVLLLAAIASTNAFGMVSVTRLSDLPKHFCGIGATPDEGWIERYEIKFTTVDRTGAERTSSGLVAFQKNLSKSSDPLLYLHATSNKLDVPSKGSFESKFVACQLLSSRRVLIAPDYLGMGDDDGRHGYMIRAEVNRVTLDMLNAVSAWFDRSKLSRNLTIAGYSQGGHSALSVHHFLEHEENDFRVAKTFAMSAPANLSEGMLSSILNDRPSNSTSYLLALVLFNYQEYYGDLLPDFPFWERYRPAASYALDMNGDRLKDLLPKDPMSALRPEFIDELVSNEDHPLRLRLKENDIPVWRPQAPIVLSYSNGDDTVPAKQTVQFFQRMKKLSNQVSLVKTAVALPHGLNFVRSIKWLAQQKFGSNRVLSAQKNRQPIDDQNTWAQISE